MPTRYFGTQRPEDAGSEFAAGNAAIKRILTKLGWNIPVEVIAVHGAGVAPTGTVDIKPLVTMQDGSGVAYDHDVIYGVPYIRIQGGTRAFICDPQPGDNGFIVIAARDISGVKANRAASPPGSFRQWDWADAVYFGGLLNEAPTEYIGWVGGNVVVQTTGQLIVNAASMQVNCSITATGDVKAGSISLENHTHSDPQGGNTGAPQ